MDNMLTWLSRRVKGCHSQVDHNRLKKGQPANNIFIVCHEWVVTHTIKLDSNALNYAFCKQVESKIASLNYDLKTL